MKFKYDLDLIVSALTYLDLKGLTQFATHQPIASGHYSLSEMEELYKKAFLSLKTTDPMTFKRLERLMLSCARENSIG